MSELIPYIAVFAPLIGFLIVGLLGCRLGDRAAQYITCGLMILAAVCSVMLFHDVVLLGHARTLVLADWISTGDLTCRGRSGLINWPW
jgi:NADH-quinone oxidoreductase subunit L